MLICVASVSVAQETPEPKDQKSKPEATSQVPDSASIPEAPATVNVSEVVFDDKIEERLRSIFEVHRMVSERRGTRPKRSGIPDGRNKARKVSYVGL